MSRRIGLFARTLVLAAGLPVLALAPMTALAQGAGAPVQPVQNSSGVTAIVNGFVISNYDLDQRIALFIATSGVRPTTDTLPQIRAQVLRSLEDEAIELQEAGKRRINVSNAEVEKALQNIAADNKLSVPQILNTIGQAGVTAATFRQQLSAQIAWQKLVASRYGPDIQVTDQQLDEAMNRLKQGADKSKFLVSEIYIGVDRPEDETSVRASAEQFTLQIMQGAPFQTVAGQFSQSPSAADGGDIGWVIQGQLADELDHALFALRPGQIAGPIRAEGGYYILLLRDRREPSGANPAEAQATPAADPNAPLPLDRFLIPLPANPDAVLKNRAMTLAANVKSQLRSCADLPNIANQLAGTVYERLGSMSPKDLNPELRDALSKTVPGEIVNPFFSPAGLELIMRCDAPPPNVGQYELPTREQLQQQLLQEKMSLYAKSYLRDLRQSAAVSATAGR